MMEAILRLADLLLVMLVGVPFAFVIAILLACLLAWWGVFVFQFVVFVFSSLKDFLSTWTNPFKGDKL